LGIANGASDDFFDTDDKKAFYFKATYKVMGMGEVGGAESAKASEESKNYVDNSLKIGAFGYFGHDVVESDGHDFSQMGISWDFYFNQFNLFGVYSLRSDELEGTSGKLKSAAWFAEAHGVIYPWLVGFLRYEWTDQNTDDDAIDPRTTIIPGLSILARANISFTLEYQKPLDDARKDSDALVLGMKFAL